MESNIFVKNLAVIATIIVIVGAIFSAGVYYGNTKFDRNLIELTDINKTLKDSIRMQDNHIKLIQRNSDSAHQILARMPYKEMTLDTLSYRKVQTTIENAGAALNLNNSIE